MTAANLKAKELVDKFQNELRSALYSPYNTLSAKECAIIAVDEILDVLGGAGVYSFADSKVTDFWEEVKQQINLL